jgi:4-amino-4-deoxy-L-arabinose transferase-like glycosyltransferase
MLIGIATVLATTALIAVVAAPNNWDSMTYHLARVVHWLQNATVAHYPTSNLRQLQHPPFAEFVVMHTFLLSGGDGLANLVQWFATAGSALGVALIALSLGAQRTGATVAAVICVTIPMGILQSTSTQTDAMASFWLVCTVYFGLRCLDHCTDSHLQFGDVLAAGASLGFGVLTKDTIYIFALPFLVVWGVLLLRRSARLAIRVVTVASVAVLLLNAGHYARNWQTFGAPLGPREDATRYVNQVHTLAAITSNVVRNIGIHLGTPSARANALLERAVRGVHLLVGIAPDDPRTSWKGMPFEVVGLSRHEDYAGNPLHLLLFFGCFAGMIAVPRMRKLHLAWYAGSVAAGFLLFSFVLRWQPWHSRLVLPLFVVASPFMACLLLRAVGKRLAVATAALLLVASIPWVGWNQTRPLFGARSVLHAPRDAQYFFDQAELRAPYDEAVRLVVASHCTRVGLLIGGNAWEYPLWRMMRPEGQSPIRVRHVGVSNVSANLPEPAYENAESTCAVIRVTPLQRALWPAPPAPFRMTWNADSLSVFLR